MALAHPRYAAASSSPLVAIYLRVWGYPCDPVIDHKIFLNIIHLINSYWSKRLIMHYIQHLILSEMQRKNGSNIIQVIHIQFVVSMGLQLTRHKKYHEKKLNALTIPLSVRYMSLLDVLPQFVQLIQKQNLVSESESRLLYRVGTNCCVSLNIKLETIPSK